MQRGGHGRQLFDLMLKDENIQPQNLAYDRPSPKLLGFLSKHFGLRAFIKQTHHFVVFDQYFTNPTSLVTNKQNFSSIDNNVRTDTRPTQASSTIGDTFMDRTFEHKPMLRGRRESEH